MWTGPEIKDLARTTGTEDGKLKLVLDGCDSNLKVVKWEPNDILGEVSKTHHAIETRDKTISTLEMELAAARATQESILNGAPISENLKVTESPKKIKYLMVVGINTAYSSRKRRDSIRATWLPQEFADMSWEEFQQKLGAAQNCSATTKGNYKLTDALLPPVKDWREEGIVSPVKNQGSCGSCWTFRIRLVAVATQKFIAEVSTDALQHAHLAFLDRLLSE